MDWNTTAVQDRHQLDPAAVFAAGLQLHHIANTAYPIGHTTTMRPYRVPRSRAQALAPQAWQEIREMGLYVHVPFCAARCGYCEYTVLDPSYNEQEQDAYFDLLLREFELYGQALGARSRRLTGFDIGGGTPSLPSTRHIARVVEAAHRHFRLAPRMAISIETTPKIAAQEPGKIQAYFEFGIRRISMGVQTVNPCLLAAVGRTSTSLRDNQTAAENIRAAGFASFNVDIMYGFANQSLASLKATLRHVIGLAPDHITLYRMRYKGTRLVHQAGQVTLEAVTQQAALAEEILAAAGYQGAPGKNTFSRLPGDPGTSDYLTNRVIHGTPYLGLGLGAQSLSHHTLAYNSGAADKEMRLYRQKVLAGQLPIQDLYHLSRQAAMAKMIAVSFYFGGINLASFRRKFGLTLAEAYPAAVAFVLEQGLMHYTNENLHLTTDGVVRKNGVMALFYTGAVQEYLLEKTRLANGD